MSKLISSFMYIFVIWLLLPCFAYIMKRITKDSVKNYVMYMVFVAIIFTLFALYQVQF
ncbi:hypothetical protein EB19_01396 [Enterococcus faecium]|uniref:hypothetical protein n=1 Tax=Enterococcus thailandicus TaxID=417368 RepID=UPI00032F5BEC|nr:hypothetical protein [Enterococcus thailandicus]EOM08177.1 hypothetical protein U9U_01190 [Enterococcus faecium EnGen0260]EOM09220.1 hypothetical protein U9W_02662 [Enterococcus faecium EnGen0261]RBS31178.1 hypothetical protein EB14_02103 [Enterococcus faecium]RBS40984.1 hypothetical protein EB19_01396 [Enterococcus faecium]RBS56523.1 hypothetical protein EB33_01710 [Enterococcus faecium]